QRAPVRSRLRDGHGDPRDGHGTHGQRCEDLRSESLESGVGRAERVRDRWLVHGVVVVRESVADVHGAHGACRGPRRRRALAAQSLTEEANVATAAFREDLVSRREAIRRVSALLGGAALVGQGAWLAGCVRSRPQPAGDAIWAVDVALLDEIADTILPPTKT